jgi:hypothetical protein
MDKKILYFEEVKLREGRTILISKVRPATKKEIAKERKNFAQGKCQHTIVEDVPGWLYDFRSCSICGKELGLI